MNVSCDQTLLAQINSPVDLRKLSVHQLATVANEIRQHLVKSLNHCGGHFGANLGSTELTIALHYVYNTPEDRLVWDVGHQAYPHKILTGRRDQLHTIKQTQGLAPFPHRHESPYDTFGVGHSSTSISAALGMSIGNRLNQNERKTVAIIGDGGLTGGMAFEALNHAGSIDPNLLVILNDNDMSISENVGALTHYFARILAGKVYCHLREGSKKVLSHMQPLSQLAKRTETHLKGMVQPGTLFEELGFNYLGPIDGHDLPALIKTLQTIKSLSGAKLLHVITQKGKGYAAAEKQPIRYHAVKPGFHTPPAAETTINKKTAALTYSNVFGQWLCHRAAKDRELVGITPAMREGSDLIEFSKTYPERYFDVGIAEQHAVTFAAGLACEGKKPVVAIYSTFLQRAYDQLIHDVAIQNLDVTFAVDRAGLVGSDGATHHGAFDLSYLRCIPNLVIMVPSDEQSCCDLLNTAYHHTGPALVRYPRGNTTKKAPQHLDRCIQLGKANIQQEGEKIAILAFGPLLQMAQPLAHSHHCTLVDMRFVKPLDTTLLTQLADTHDYFITLEDNALAGGAGSAVIEYCHDQELDVKIKRMGLPDRFIEHGSVEDQRASCELTAEKLATLIQTLLT